MVRPGYAIEYDYLPATQCDATLQTKAMRGLYFAGQVSLRQAAMSVSQHIYYMLYIIYYILYII